MVISKDKESFLVANGWEITYEGKTMDKWERRSEYNLYQLFIHISDVDQFHYCNLYVGDNERDVRYFSLRSLKSMLAKHGG